MTKRTIEIDTRDETLAAAKDDLRDYMREMATENPDQDARDYEPHDRIFEIADGATPVYTREIEDWHYLHGAEVRQAYQDAGIGTGTEDNHLAVCIFCWIEAQLWEYWRELVSEETARREEAAETE